MRTARTYTNFRLADRAKFVRETEASFASLPDHVPCNAGERVFRDVVLAASGHCIPSSHRKEHTPGLPYGAVPLVNRRDRLCRVDPLDPEISSLNDEFHNVICESLRKTWADKVELCGPCSNPTKF